jgi:hypothetical protein
MSLLARDWRPGDCARGAFCEVGFLWSLTSILMGEAGFLPHLYEMWRTRRFDSFRSRLFREPDGSPIATIDDARIRQPEG